MGRVRRFSQTMAPPFARRFAQRLARHLGRGSMFERRGHYYSPLLGPADIARRGSPNGRIRGITIDDEAMWLKLEALGAIAHGLELARVPTPGRSFYTANSWYGAADAALLQSMIRLHRPSRIVEAGSGFSTAAALDAVRGTDTRIATIDPDASRLRELGLIGHPNLDVIEAQVQDADLALFESLSAGDFLVLDTSHVGKTGSDVLWHLFEVLPRLASGVFVHVHDTFPGFEYPLNWMEEGRSWNELYLLRAFLEFNTRFSIELWPAHLWSRDAVRAAAAVPQLAEANAGQLWIRVVEEGA